MNGALRNALAVLPGRVVDDAVVVWEDGIVVSVTEGGPAPRGSHDAAGAVLIPGLVDVHSDGLEQEVKPRPGVELPIDFALLAFERRARAAGITTLFHGVAFSENAGWGRSLEMARSSRAAIGARTGPGTAVDHHVLHRLDARDPIALDAILEQLPRPGSLVSFEDHTPGQGQFRDVERLKQTVGVALPPSVDVGRYVDEVRAVREAMLPHYALNRERIAALAAGGQIRLVGHDLEDAAAIAEAHEWGAVVAEFPLGVEAAAEARRRGMPVVMGAPNVLLGRSHSGNVAAEDLVRRGLCDVLASDYQPFTMLAAAFQLVGKGAAGLPGAIRLITLGPAEAVGLGDRGAIAPGRRADLVLVDAGGRWPAVAASWRAGQRLVVETGPTQEAP